MGVGFPLYNGTLLIQCWYMERFYVLCFHTASLEVLVLSQSGASLMRAELFDGIWGVVM